MSDQTSTLHGRRIVVTRAGEAGQRFAELLRAHGATPIVCPTIAIVPPADLAPLDAALVALDSYDWLVCTSANAVTALLDRLPLTRGDTNRPRNLRIGAVGPATAAALVAAGWGPDCVPPTHTADALADALGAVQGCRILFPASDIARPTLVERLRSQGATVTKVTAYRTIAASPEQLGALTAQLQAGTIDAVTFTSPSTVHGFLPLLAGIPRTSRRPAIICVGPSTAAAAHDAGLEVTSVATDHTAGGLLTALYIHCNSVDPTGVDDTNTNQGARSCSI